MQPDNGDHVGKGFFRSRLSCLSYDETEGVSVGRRRSGMKEQEIFAALRQFDEAGNISVKEFAAAYQISEATYYNWRKRYQTKNAIAPAGFMEVDLSGLGKEQSRGEVFAEFRGIIFYQRVDATYLKSCCKHVVINRLPVGAVDWHRRHAIEL